MHVYDESDMLYENLGANISKGEFFHDATSWKIVKQMKKTNKNLSKKVKKNTSQEQGNVLLNAMNLYEGRNKIIKLYEDRNIKPSKYPHSAKFEATEYDGVQESEQKSEESRVKLRRQKADDKADYKEILIMRNQALQVCLI